MAEYVSENVAAALFSESSKKLPQLVNKNKRIKWKTIQEIITQETINKINSFEIEENTSEEIQKDFKKISKIIFKLGSEAYINFTRKQEINNQEINKLINQFYSINIEEIILSINNDDKIKLYAIFCCVLSLIERILIDITLIQNNENSPPKILKDLLKYPATVNQLLSVQVR